MQPLPAPPPGSPYRAPGSVEPTPLGPAARGDQEYTLAPIVPLRRPQSEFLPKVIWEQAKEGATAYGRSMGRFYMLSMLAHIFAIAVIAILAGKFSMAKPD